MSLFEKWLYALKINSWPKLLVPFFLGQGIGFTHSAQGSFVIFFMGFLFTVFLLGYIVLLNDYADINVDTIKRKLFPNDCSPKTIPDQILDSKTVLWGGLLMGLLSILMAFILQFYTGKDFIVLFSFLCVIVFAAYSLPPIRLNYRGGGEFLEMMGVGLMLPLFHFYLQAGISIDLMLVFILIMSTLYAFSSALASGLSDEESDRIGGKNTFVTFFGNQRTRTIIDFIILFNYVYLLGFCIFFKTVFPFYTDFVLILYSLYHIYFILKFSGNARTNEFQFQKMYKDHIHKLIWGFVSLFTFLLNLEYFFKMY